VAHPSHPVKRPWAAPAADVLQHLGVAADQGLTDAEAQDRRRRYGPNRLRQTRRRSAWAVLADQFRSLIVLLLAVAGGLSFAFGHWVEGFAVLAVIAVNAAIGFVTELKAVRSMEALHRQTSVTARVRRGGRERDLPAADLVPGDIVLVEGGDVVPADLRVIDGSRLQADESPLTGESVPVDKDPTRVPGDAALGDRTGMLFGGTSVTRGSGVSVVVATGMATEIGHISSLVAEAEAAPTSLEVRLEHLGRRLIVLTLVVAAAVTVSGVVAGKPLLLMVETGIALAVAAIPEGLPIVATVALARGMWRMARRNALINHLSAVEALGGTTVICCDKTGTLTENRMTVTRLALAGGDLDVPDQGGADGPARELLEVGVLCNNATLEGGPDGGKGHGDPMEVALLAAAERAGVQRRELAGAHSRVREEAFDPAVRMMATVHRSGDRFRVAVKGAPEAVLEKCDRVRTPDGERTLTDAGRVDWRGRAEQLADGGLRLLGLGAKQIASADDPPYAGLTLLGLVGLLDPPRAEVPDAVRRCREAGIRVVMVTGDHAVTARAIADQVGLTEAGEAVVLEGRNLNAAEEMTDADRERLRRAVVLARVSPRQKLDLIAAHQAAGAVVAMTGDGVNDAPALKKADIGIAMGKRGTQVAREAADMVLKDDAFATIVAAVGQGRVIFTNIRKFVVYLLSCNLSEILVVGLAALAGRQLPVLPLQILFLNLVTDVFPALALGVGEGDAGNMRRPPRKPGSPVLARPQWLAVGTYGLMLTAAVLGAFALAQAFLGMSPVAAVTVSFLTLGFAQVFHVFNMRSAGSGLVRNDVTRNPYVWGAVALCTALLVLAVYVPGMNRVLGTTDPGLNGWALVAAMSLLPLAAGQAGKALARDRRG
jgi:Ca2+-transporting ATPase